jgi:sterol desaturase/sphingolipid hydroxylase (fatty acid hydroxylase superfamily)
MYYFKYLITDHGQLIQLCLFAVLFFISWNIEIVAGRYMYVNKKKHAFINTPFIITSIPGQVLLGFAFAKTIQWTTLHQFGFLYHIPFTKNSLFLFLISFIFLDFGEYIYHIIMHKVKGLWIFHMVHHSDHFVDVSTTLREHPAENFIRLSFTLLWVFISGTVFWVLLLRQIIQVISTLFAHINYHLPEKTERMISLVFITPNLHQVHHHYQQPYTDCNYGDVLSIWDRIFGTFIRLPSENVVFGVDTFMNNEASGKFISLLRFPFRKYKQNKKLNHYPFSNPTH